MRLVPTWLRLVLTGVVTVALMGGVAVADDIDYKDDGTIDTATDTLTMTVGQVADVKYTYTVTNTGNQGCDLTGSQSSVTFDVNSSTGGVVSISPSQVTFANCGAEATITITAQAAGSTTVSLSHASHTSSCQPSGNCSWDTAGATFVVNVAGAEGRAAPAIANEYLRDRGDTSDCVAAQGTNRNKSNWHGNLINQIAHHFQGQTFLPGEEGPVHDAVETLCAGGTL